MGILVRLLSNQRSYRLFKVTRDHWLANVKVLNQFDKAGRAISTLA